MGSILSKGSDSINGDSNEQRNNIYLDYNNDIMSSPSSTLIANHIRQPSIRSRNLQPMPNSSELDRRFAKVLVSKRNSMRFFVNHLALLFFFFVAINGLASRQGQTAEELWQRKKVGYNLWSGNGACKGSAVTLSHETKNVSRSQSLT